MHMGNIVNCTENILIVDDVTENLVVLTDIITSAGYIPRPVSSVELALQAIDIIMPHLILVNVSLPLIDGFQFCTELKKNETTKEIPVIFISDINSTQDKMKGFKLGAADFIVKPFESKEVTVRVNTHLQLYKMKNDIVLNNRKLHKHVYDQLQKIAEDQKNLIYVFAKLLGSNNDEKAKHMERISKNSRILAMSLQLSPKSELEISDSFIDLIDLASSLHDIGKLFINDNILLKPDKLTSEETEIMKSHAEIGADTLKDIYSYYKQNEYVKMAIEIACSHHEKWNGKGYPKGLSGKDIPLAARIVAVVDVYDALTSKRCYKPAYTREYSLLIMNEELGKSFDPNIIEVFNKIEKQLQIGDESTKD